MAISFKKSVKSNLLTKSDLCVQTNFTIKRMNMENQDQGQWSSYEPDVLKNFINKTSSAKINHPSLFDQVVKSSKELKMIKALTEEVQNYPNFLVKEKLIVKKSNKKLVKKILNYFNKKSNKKIGRDFLTEKNANDIIKNSKILFIQENTHYYDADHKKYILSKQNTLGMSSNGYEQALQTILNFSQELNISVDLTPKIIKELVVGFNRLDFNAELESLQQMVTHGWRNEKEIDLKLKYLLKLSNKFQFSFPKILQKKLKDEFKTAKEKDIRVKLWDSKSFKALDFNYKKLKSFLSNEKRPEESLDKYISKQKLYNIFEKELENQDEFYYSTIYGMKIWEAFNVIYADNPQFWQGTKFKVLSFEDTNENAIVVQSKLDDQTKKIGISFSESLEFNFDTLENKKDLEKTNNKEHKIDLQKLWDNFDSFRKTTLENSFQRIKTEVEEQLNLKQFTNCSIKQIACQAGYSGCFSIDIQHDAGVALFYASINWDKTTLKEIKE